MRKERLDRNTMKAKQERESRKKELLRKVQDPRYIPGIYNYCDRWCERCPFTSRCLQCAFDQEGDCENLDMDSDAFLEKITESLQTAFDLVKDMAEEAGINLDEVEPFEEEEDDRVVHILLSLSEKYADMVDQWMQENASLRLHETAQQNRTAGLKLVKPRVPAGPYLLEDIVEVIHWHQYQIYVKLKRAFESKKDEMELSLDDFPRDSEGSAKVALIGIDRSMSAWGKMAAHFPKEREIPAMIQFLARLRQITEREFPGARAFKRPGFDDDSR